MLKNKRSNSSEADALLEQGEYKKAIKLYKHLLEQEVCPVWQEALKLAYLKWFQALVTKKMTLEAITLWESCLFFRQEPQATIESYLLCLIQVGHSTKAVQTFLEVTESLDASGMQRCLVLMGILLLTERKLLEYFPVDSILRQHYDMIQQALLTYCQGENPETLLKHIPFRSPYRDLRQILKALVNPNHTHYLLEKIPPDSPYRPFVEILQWNVSKLIREFHHLNQFEQHLLVSLKGLNHAQVVLLNRLTRLHDVRLMFKMLLAESSLVKQESIQQFCLALLPSHFYLIHLYEKAFGPLSTFDRHHIQALAYEHQKHLRGAEKQWEACVEFLKVSPDEPQQALKIALILRHLVDLSVLQGTSKDEEIIKRFKESLQFDPKDKATHLQVMELLKQHDYKQEYALWMELAVRHFPQDGEILEMASRTAWQKKAYRKAITLATKLFQQEPFHPQAKQILFACHVGYARKLIKTGKYKLAYQELEQSMQLASPRQSTAFILQGLLIWQEGGDQNTVWHWFKKSEELDEGKWFHLFHLSVEAYLVEVNMSFPPLERNYLPSSYEILRWVNLLNIYYQEGYPEIGMQLERFKTPAQRAATQVTFSQSEMITICQCFRQIGHYELLYHYAHQALQRWPAIPILVFYQITGRSQNEVFNLHETELDALQQAVDNAQQQGDQRTVMLIMRFLEKLIQSPSEEYFEIFLLDEDKKTKKPSPQRGRKK